MGKYIKKFDTHSDYEDFIETEDFIKPNISYCADDVEVHYNPIPDPYNGHAYVDLGLPSGTLWATMNVGATSETDYGLYFAWGETQGYTDASTKAFSWSDYKWTEDGGSTMSKYNETDDKTVLDLEDDAVATNWGGEWHIPTQTQFQELLNTMYVTNTWVTNYQGSGINGCLFTSVNNGNILFVPAAGLADKGRMYGVNNSGIIQSSTRRNVNLDYFMYFTNDSVMMDYGNRYKGCSVRGVVG